MASRLIKIENPDVQKRADHSYVPSCLSCRLYRQTGNRHQRPHRRVCGQRPKTPEFIQDEDFCTIIWRKNASGQQGPDKENDKENRRQLTVNENIVISFIKSADKENDKEKLTTAYIAKQIGLSYSTAQRIIAKLKTLSLVHRIGGDKGGYWTCSEE